MMKGMMNLLVLPTLVLFATGVVVQAAADDADLEQIKKCVVVVKGCEDAASVASLTAGAEADADGLTTVVIGIGEGEDPGLVLHGPGHDALPGSFTLVAGAENDPSRGWLGVSLGEVSPALAVQLGLEDEGVMINNVVKDSPAAEAGLQRYDVVVALDGEGFDGSLGSLAARIGELGPGTTADLTVIRSGKEQTLAVTLGSRPDGGEMEWEYEFTDLSSVTDKYTHRGRVMMRGPDGKIQIHELGDLKALKDLPDSIRCMIPGIKDTCTRLWVDKDKGSVGIRIKTRVEEDGQTIEIEQQDGKITVRRTTVDDQGNTQTTEETYDDSEALEAADEEAYEFYSGIQGPHVLDLNLDHLGQLDLDIDLDIDDVINNLDDVMKDQSQWREELEKALQKAGKDYEVALKCLDSARGLKLGPLGRGVRWFGHSAERAQQSFSVAPDGSIEVRLRKGDSEVVMNYESEEDLAKRNPEMYEKYSDVINAPVEE
ncbi:MAG: S1C family serine protease [Planctomycetota bacterium]|jgi:hypothetical protein